MSHIKTQKDEGMLHEVLNAIQDKSKNSPDTSALKAAFNRAFERRKEKKK